MRKPGQVFEKIYISQIKLIQFCYTLTGSKVHLMYIVYKTDGNEIRKNCKNKVNYVEHEYKVITFDIIY